MYFSASGITRIIIIGKGGKKGVGGGGTPVDSDERGGDRTIQ